LAISLIKVARRHLGLAPLLIFMAIFLGIPLITIVRFSFINSAGEFTLQNFYTISTGIYRDAYWLSFKLSFVSAAISLILGFAFAYALVRSDIGFIKNAISTASGVLANTGGVPLAFMFIAVLGTYGMLTSWLKSLGIEIYGGGWTLYSFSGILIVYLYFQVPLMVLISIPVLENIRREWREAATTLGASSWMYWRWILMPILSPQLLAFFLLLFANSFAAYATAAALTSGSLALVPVQIASLIGSNVQVDGVNTAMALGMGMVVLVGISTIGYSILEKQSSKWRR
jgi:putative spermidine/putrescine transport system permease protein